MCSLLHDALCWSLSDTNEASHLKGGATAVDLKSMVRDSTVVRTKGFLERGNADVSPFRLANASLLDYLTLV